VEAGASVGLVLLGAGVTGAAFGRAIGYVFGGIVGLVLVARTIGTRSLRTKTPPPVGSRRLAGYAGALFIIDGAYSLLGSSGTLLIGAFLDARHVGLFQPAIRLITFLHYPGLSVSTAIAPRLARRPGSEPDVPALERALRWLVLIQTVLVAPLIVWAHPLTKIVLGSGYGRTADVLMVLAPYTFLTGFAPLVSLSVNYLGEARRRVPVAIITLVLSVALNAALIPLIGIIGTAVSTDISYGFYVIAHFWICRRLLGLRLRPLLRDLVRCVVAAAAMAGVMAAFGTSTLAAWQIVAGGTLGIAVYVGALFALGAMSVSEARVAIDAVRRKLGRRRRAVEAS
jgi:O-antigen/teichoic acid export membrane protein